ncbi:cysteine dioxygenase [Rugosimonospora acidiphila]|uniref:Cysteine dioxygenase n=1 Tax=Rugosimonospora acidiphila TaxID=556531 RepID=A0ABP9RTM6_9ACTN
MPNTALSEPMAALLAEIAPVVHGAPDGARAAGDVRVVLERWLGIDELLTPAQLEPDPHRYRQHLIHVDRDGAFGVVALVWLPGQRTPIHDHVCWCVVGVHRGAEREVCYRVRHHRGMSFLEPTTDRVNPRGTTSVALPPADIHQVANNGDGLVASVHVYGADIGTLGTSIRRTYKLPVRRMSR